MGQPQAFNTIGDSQVIGWFFQDYTAAAQASWVPQLANVVQSNQDIETYAGVGLVPAMREWVGQRIAKQLREYSFTVANKEWELTLAVKSKDLRRDKTGQLRIRIGELASRAAEHDAKLLTDIIENGAATTYYSTWESTAKALFASDHAIGGSGTIDNTIDSDISGLATGVHGSTTAPSVGEFGLSVMAGVQQIIGFKDDQGEPLNVMPRQFLVMVPTGLMNVANAATQADYVASGERNPLLNMSEGMSISVAVNPRLTWTDKFAVFNVGSPAKPFILQQEVPVTMEALGEGSDHTFKEHEHLYSAWKSCNVAINRFDRACLVTLV